MIAALLDGSMTRVRRSDAVTMLKHAGYTQLPDGAIARNRARNASVAFQYGDDLTKHIVLEKHEFIAPSVVVQISKQLRVLGFPREQTELQDGSSIIPEAMGENSWQQGVSNNRSSRELS